MPTRAGPEALAGAQHPQERPEAFEGRKLGVLVTRRRRRRAAERAASGRWRKAGAVIEIVAPTVGGVKASDGSWIEAQQKIDGGPSVLFDAVALLPSEAGAARCCRMRRPRDFVADAFAHCKFIGHSAAAKPLLDKAGVQPDEGVVPLTGKKDVDAFVGALGALRLWDREPKVKLQPDPAPARGRPASAARGENPLPQLWGRLGRGKPRFGVRKSSLASPPQPAPKILGAGVTMA